MSRKKLVSIGNYSLTGHRLGKGTFAYVEVSNHAIIKKPVALKVMNKMEITDDYVTKNYRREADILAKVYHPNIVKLIEVLESTDYFCMALELCRSGSLLNLLNKVGRINDSYAKKITRQMVAGLVYLHGKGIIHRDLKLENVLLSDGGRRVVLADFGLSSTWHLGKKMNTFCGSVEYAAPELFYKFDNYNCKVDIWSMGIITYAMVTGNLPFRAKDSDMGSSTLIKRILGGMKKPQFDEMGMLNLNLRVFLIRCIETDSKVRYDSRTATHDQWLTSGGLHPFREAPEDSLSQENQLQIASTIKEGLKSTHSPESILAHWKRRTHYTTGGMFNLLSLEFLEAKRKKEAAAERARLQAQKLYPSLKKKSQQVTSTTTDEPATSATDGYKENLQPIVEPAWKRERTVNGDLTRLRRKEDIGVAVDKKNIAAEAKHRAPLSDLTNQATSAAAVQPNPTTAMKRPPLRPKNDQDSRTEGQATVRPKLRIR